MLISLRNMQARRRLRVSVDCGAGADPIHVRAANVSRRPVTIQHVAIAWPYRRVKLADRLRAFFKHGHHWTTIGWTHQRLGELDAELQLPTAIQPRRSLEFDLPTEELKGAWDDGHLTFVLRLRDVRGRNYYSRVCRLSR